MASVTAWRPALDFVRHSALREVVGHWLSLLHDGALPERRQLDPAQMKSALPYVWICQRELTGRYRVRLAGSEINELIQQPLRGRMLDEVLNEAEWEELKEKCDEVLGIPALVWSEGPIFESEPRGALGECVMLPLAEHRRRIVVLGATVHGLEHVRIPGHLLARPPKTIHIVPLADL